MPGEFYIKFWGVRGTIPVPASNTNTFGGNTSCVEVRCNGRQIIFDAGTGLFPLGRDSDICHSDIFLSHTHLDHIQGLPFYKPMYKEGSNVALWAGHLLPESTIEEVIGHIMRSPVFPLTIDQVLSKVEFNNFYAGEDISNEGLEHAGISIKTMYLNHPDRATGYRLTYNDKSVCYITDIEHEEGNINQKLIEFVAGADVLIYDSTYDDEEFHIYKGWGHSTWQEAMRIADKAGVKQLIPFHHDPYAIDSILAKREQSLIKLRPGSLFAREGMRVDLI